MYLENKKEIRNYERQYCRLICYAHYDTYNHEFHAVVFNKHQFLFVFKVFHNFSCFSQILIPLII